MAEIPNLHTIWKQLLANSDADTSRRLRLDPGNRPDGRKLTVLMDPQGTKGFSATIDQLLESKVIWVPDLDVFLSAGPIAGRVFRTIARLSPDGVGRGSWTS